MSGPQEFVIYNPHVVPGTHYGQSSSSLGSVGDSTNLLEITQLFVIFLAFLASVLSIVVQIWYHD